ncbi:single-stranded DNA-binding protein [Micromonospora sp. NEAU-HG-1]|nr:single-stranded DNA-binding protein [Micromonospora rubida]NBE80278.1 single-stranded DNA-binding protein [Micromonospora rubida]
MTAPEWRRTAQSNTLVANFKVASTARRLDRDSGRWVDGNSLRVRVNCWRKLAEGVASSVMVGDPVVVAGRLYTRDWTDEAGNHRTLYELEAVAVGHDLARGRGRFLRNRPTMATSTVEDAEAETRVHGEPTERVPQGQAPVSPADRPFDEDFEPGGFDQARGSFDAPRAGRGLAGSPDFEDLAGDPFDDRADPADDELTEPGVDGGDDLSPLPDGEGPSGEVARAGEVGLSAQGGPGDPEPSGGEPDGVTPDRRGRRGRGRVPVPA